MFEFEGLAGAEMPDNDLEEMMAELALAAEPKGRTGRNRGYIRSTEQDFSC
jgi:hypothetical protein